jgi:Ca2+-binding EF-hand superfamily protein
MKQFGYHPSEQEIKNIIGKIDQDSNGTIELSEFLNFI